MLDQRSIAYRINKLHNLQEQVAGLERLADILREQLEAEMQERGVDHLRSCVTGRVVRMATRPETRKLTVA